MNANPSVVPAAAISSSMPSHGRSAPDCELNAILYWSGDVSVGGVAYDVWKRHDAALLFGSSFAPVTEPPGVVPAFVVRAMPTSICWLVGTAAPARTPTVTRRSLQPMPAIGRSQPNPVSA